MTALYYRVCFKERGQEKIRCLSLIISVYDEG